MSYATKPTILTTTRVFTGTLVSKVALGNTHTVMNHHFEKAQTWRSRSSSLVAKSKVATSMVSPLTLHLNIRAAYSTFVLPKSPFKDSRFEFFTIKGCLVVEKMERSIWELRILALRSQANWRFLLSLESNLAINLAGDKGWAQHFLSHGHALHMLIMKVLSLQQITGYKIMYSQGKEKVPHMCTK